MNDHKYHTRYHPPVPAVELALLAPAGDIGIGPLLAVLDSGADGTLVPTSLLERLGTPSVYQTGIRSHWGERRRVDIHLVDLRIEGRRLDDVEVVADDLGREVVLGRNVLNQLILLLDGPAEEALVLNERP